MSNSPDFEFNDELKKLIDSDNFFTQFEMDIIKHLRNKKSQQYMNKKLGFNFNQYAKWENGTKKVLWSDVINILKVQKINLSKGFLGRFINNTTSLEETGPQFVQIFLKSYFQDDIKLFGQYLKVTVPRARRMIKDKNVSFNTMLQLFIYRPMNMIYFLKENKIIHHFPEFESDFQKLESFEQLEALYPFASTVLYFTGTTLYKKQKIHSDEYVAQHLGLTIEQVQLSMKELMERKHLRKVGKLFIFNEKANELNTLTRAQRYKIVSYWNYRAIHYLQQKIDAPDDSPLSIKNIIGFKLYLTTKKVANEIDELLVDTYHKISKMLKETQETPEDEVLVKVLSLNNFSIEECPNYDFELDREMGLIKKNESAALFK